MVKWFTIAFLVLTLAATPGWGNEVKFYLEVDPSKGTTDDVFSFAVVIEGVDPQDYPILEGGDDFKLSYVGPQKSVTMSNGRRDFKTRYVYRLFPEKEGSLETPSAELTIGDKRYTATAKNVIVTKSDSANVKANAEVFVRQLLDKKEVFVGEQVVNSIELYTRVGLADFQLEDVPLDGFWKTEIDKYESTVRVIDGHRYKIIRRKDALFPLRAGKMALPKRLVSGKIKSRSQHSRFSIFNHYELKPGRWRSNALGLTVLELPPAPTRFAMWNSRTPIVGATSLTASFSVEPIDVGDGKTIDFILKSEGNINPLSEIPLTLPNHLKAYNETPHVETSEELGRLLTTKRFVVSVVPTRPGEVSLPPIELGYFDPQSKSYQTAKTKPIRFLVRGSTAEPLSSDQPSAQTEDLAPPVSQDSVPRYEEESFVERFSRQVSLSLSLLLIALLIIATITVAALMRWQRGKQPERSLIAAVEQATSLDELSLAFRAYLAHKLSGVNAASTGEQLRAEIRRGVKNSGREYAIQGILDEFDQSLYGNHREQSTNIALVRQKIETVIRDWR